MSTKKRTAVRVILVLAVILGGLFGLYKLMTRPSLAGYQKNFDFSLKGLRVVIVDHYYEEAFQDPWSGYVVRVSGSVSGSVFDPATMDEGLPDVVKNTLALNNSDMLAAGREPLFKETAGAAYRTRILVDKTKTDHPERLDNRLFIIYAPAEELYYVFYETFIASN